MKVHCIILSMLKKEKIVGFNLSKKFTKFALILQS